MIHHHNPDVHASWEIKARAWIQGTYYALVNASHMIQKSPTRPMLLGQIARPIPPIWDFHPPWFAIFIFYFSIIVLFILWF